MSLVDPNKFQSRAHYNRFLREFKKRSGIPARARLDQFNVRVMKNQEAPVKHVTRGGKGITIIPKTAARGVTFAQEDAGNNVVNPDIVRSEGSLGDELIDEVESTDSNTRILNVQNAGTDITNTTDEIVKVLNEIWQETPQPIATAVYDPKIVETSEQEPVNLVVGSIDTGGNAMYAAFDLQDVTYGELASISLDLNGRMLNNKGTATINNSGLIVSGNRDIVDPLLQKDELTDDEYDLLKTHISMPQDGTKLTQKDVDRALWQPSLATRMIQQKRFNRPAVVYPNKGGVKIRKGVKVDSHVLTGIRSHFGSLRAKGQLASDRQTGDRRVGFLPGLGQVVGTLLPVATELLTTTLGRVVSDIL